MKIAFMGSDPIALPFLEAVSDNQPGGVELTAVFTQPDRRTGRGMKFQANPIKQWALAKGLPVLQPSRCGEEEADYLRKHGIELVIVMAFGQILPSLFLDTPRLGVFNLHASLLPRLRGASPIHTAVALGLKETGVSFMRIIPKMDAGPVADAETVVIEASDKSADVHGKLATACVPLVERCLPELVEDRLVFQEQKPEAVTYCRIIDKSDAHLDFNAPASALANRVRAFFPWPGTVFPWEGTDIRILEAHPVDDSTPMKPGTVMELDGGALPVACGEGRLLITRMQRPGGKPLEAEEFLRGFPIPAGSTLASMPMRPLEASTPFPYKKKRKSTK